MTTGKSTRVTNVQVPGVTPAAAPEPAPESAKPADQPGTGQTDAPADDLAALKAELLDQARAEARAELQDQLRAAHTVVSETKAAGPAARTPRNYRDMHAADIDPATLIAAVLTKDGYLCPPVPEKK